MRRLSNERIALPAMRIARPRRGSINWYDASPATSMRYAFMGAGDHATPSAYAGPISMRSGGSPAPLPIPGRRSHARPAAGSIRRFCPGWNSTPEYTSCENTRLCVYQWDRPRACTPQRVPRGRPMRQLRRFSSRKLSRSLKRTNASERNRLSSVALHFPICWESSVLAVQRYRLMSRSKPVSTSCLSGPVCCPACCGACARACTAPSIASMPASATHPAPVRKAARRNARMARHTETAMR